MAASSKTTITVRYQMQNYYPVLKTGVLSQEMVAALCLTLKRGNITVAALCLTLAALCLTLAALCLTLAALCLTLAALCLTLAALCLTLAALCLTLKRWNITGAALCLTLKRWNKENRSFMQETIHFVLIVSLLVQSLCSPWKRMTR